jgi:aminopeptidase N
MSPQGPVSLGYRLGHVRNEPKVFTALVYNKSAAVLHMLRRLVGDEPFFRGVRRFYRESRFKKAGTTDFRRAMEAEAGRSLERFFARWIYGSTLPQLKLTYRRDPEGAAAVLVRVEQIGEIFDVPVAVTLHFSDRKDMNVVIPCTERVTELKIPVPSAVRDVDLNKDDGTLAQRVR